MLNKIEVFDKNSLRRLVRQLKACMTEDERQHQSGNIFAQIERQNSFRNANIICAYWPLADEVDTRQFINKWYTIKQIYLPVVVGNNLIFKQYTGQQSMVEGVFGIMEPTGSELTDLSTVNLVIVPGVAFDAAGNRMGRGRGFYDRLLNSLSADTIGVAFSCQMFAHIPTDDNDVPLKHVVSPTD